MDRQAWLDTVRAELARQKLPPGYVARLVAELSDHYHDFMEDHMSMDARDLPGVFERLGRPDELAQHAKTHFHRGPFTRRHPLLTFTLVPAVLLPLLWVVAILAMVGASKLLKGAVDAPPEWLATSLPAIAFAIVMVPVVISTVLLCRLASKAHVDWKWLMLGCAVLAFIAGAAFFNVTMSPDRHGSMSFGLGLGADIRWMQVVQFAVPLAIGGWAIWRQLQDRRQHVLS